MFRNCRLILSISVKKTAPQPILNKNTSTIRKKSAAYTLYNGPPFKSGIIQGADYNCLI